MELSINDKGELESMGKLYSRACNNAILTEYLGKDHPIFQKNIEEVTKSNQFNFKEEEKRLISELGSGKISANEFQQKYNSLKKQDHLYELFPSVRNL